MSVAKLKKALKDELETLEYRLTVVGCEDFAEYKFVIGQHLAYRNTLQTIKDITDGNQKSRSGDVTSED